VWSNERLVHEVDKSPTMKALPKLDEDKDEEDIDKTPMCNN